MKQEATLILVAKGSQYGEQWKKRLREGKSIILGRSPHSGWAVNWDERISREHAVLLLQRGQLTVTRMDRATNPIKFGWRRPKQFTMKPGQEFQIGRTTFRMVEVMETPKITVGDRFTISREVATGPLGKLYRASDNSSDMPVALKLIDARWAANPQVEDRLLQQTQDMAKIREGNVVLILDSGRHKNELFLATEYVVGTSFADLLRKNGVLSFQRSVQFMRDAARGLASLQTQGLVHRNLTINNIFVRSTGSVQLLDVGILHTMSEISELYSGQEEPTEGIIDYISPEMLTGNDAVDVRSDIYSLGCIWYHLLTGQPPFPLDEFSQKANAHVEFSPEPIRELNSQVPEVVVSIVDRMMAKDVNERFQSTEELINVLSSPQFTGISVVCPECGESYVVKHSLAGRRVKCKLCDSAINIRAIVETA